MPNHVIDPTYFFDAILEFAFDYEWYAAQKRSKDEFGRVVRKFDKQIINGSLQPQAGSINFNIDGNTHTLKYKFYCKAMYRIEKEDFIHYKNRWLHVDETQDYDEWGVREASLTMVNLTDYKDFKDYLAYLNGEKII